MCTRKTLPSFAHPDGTDICSGPWTTSIMTSHRLLTVPPLELLPHLSMGYVAENRGLIFTSTKIFQEITLNNKSSSKCLNKVYKYNRQHCALWWLGARYKRICKHYQIIMMIHLCLLCRYGTRHTQVFVTTAPVIFFFLLTAQCIALLSIRL